MKHKLLKVMILLILLGGAIFSCRQNFGDLFDPGDKYIEDARYWYEMNKPHQGIALKSANSKGGRHNVRPDWGHAYTKQHPDFTTVQVPLSMQGALAFVTPDCKQAYEQTHDERYLQTLTQMVVVTEKGAKGTLGFLMTIIPDKAYREATKFKAFYSSYKSWQKNFSGYIFYHTLEGEFANGWKFESGKAVKTVSQKSGQAIGLQLKSANEEECIDFYAEIWSQDCTDRYTQTETTISFNGTTCSAWYYDGEAYLYAECYYTPYYDPYSGGGGGGGGEYTPPEPEPCTCTTCPICGGCLTAANSTACPAACPGHNPQAYVSQTGDILCNPNLSSTMSPQFPNTCVTSIMAYVNNSFCGGNTNEGVYMTDYLNTYNGLVIRDGVSLSAIRSFVDRHFNTTSFSGFQDAIDNGRIVMTDVASDIPGSSHNVAVVGYHPNGILIYMDPEKGCFWEAPASSFVSNYIISISSCK